MENTGALQSSSLQLHRLEPFESVNWTGSWTANVIRMDYCRCSGKTGTVETVDFRHGGTTMVLRRTLLFPDFRCGWPKSEIWIGNEFETYTKHVVPKRVDLKIVCAYSDVGLKGFVSERGWYKLPLQSSFLITVNHFCIGTWRRVNTKIIVYRFTYYSGDCAILRCSRYL